MAGTGGGKKLNLKEKAKRILRQETNQQGPRKDSRVWGKKDLVESAARSGGRNTRKEENPPRRAFMKGS